MVDYLNKIADKSLQIYQTHPVATTLGALIAGYNVFGHFLEAFTLNMSRKAVFITGCDFGMGKATALAMAKKGFYVYAGCLRPEGIFAIETEAKSLKGIVVGVKCDITSDEEVQKAAEFVTDDLRQHEGLQLFAVLNNAGVFTTYGCAEWHSMDEYKLGMELNFYGAVRVSKAFLPLIRESRGRIAVTTSVAARMGTIGGSSYSAAKAALGNWAEAFALENKSFGIKIGIIEPGIFKTSLIDDEAKRKRVNGVWDKLEGKVKEVYGDEFKEGFLVEWNEIMQAQGSSDISPVINSYIHFVSAYYPRFRYQAGSNSKYFYGPLSLIPSNWYHRILFWLVSFRNKPAYVKSITSK